VGSDGKKLFLDNEVSDHEECITFDKSVLPKRVKVPMMRFNGGSYVKARPPAEDETERFLDANPHMRHWAVRALIDGLIRCSKVSLGGIAHDSLPHLGRDSMNRLIRANAIDGIDKVPPMGSDPVALEEIDNCEGCKAKMSAPVMRNRLKPLVVEPTDCAVDISVYPCKQVKTAAMYGSLFALMYFALPFYVSHGVRKDGFEQSFDTVRVRMLNAQKLDLAKGRIFTHGPTGVLQPQPGDVFTKLHSDYDSVIVAFDVRKHMFAQDVEVVPSAPNAHHRNPAENYMCKVKHSAMAMQCLAGLPDFLMEVCWQYAAVLWGLALPRKRHHPDHEGKTPIQCFTGVKPKWKHVEGKVIGMI
jgi:hypothetical protein